jgi:dTDP-4-dehydrorhamnose 3,5-epimerase
MIIRPSSIPNLELVETTQNRDDRGAFARLYCEKELSTLIGAQRIVQINHSCTLKAGAVRGLHFQFPPHSEIKLVRCLRGRVWDIAVDLRKDSQTFLQWHAEELSSINMNMMVIPKGFAHGFQALEPESELLYLHTAPYTPGAEGGLRFNDPALQIEWPMRITDISLRDKCHPLIDSNFQGISL